MQILRVSLLPFPFSLDARRFSAAFFLLLCATASAEAAGEYRTVEIESLKITIDSEWGVRTAPGYLPVRFDITNLAEARVIEIIGQGSRFFRVPMRPGQQGSIDVRQAVRLARGDRVRLTIPVPVFASNENIRFEIREDGRTLERFNFTGFLSSSPPADAPRSSWPTLAAPLSTWRSAGGEPSRVRQVTTPQERWRLGRERCWLGPAGPARPEDLRNHWTFCSTRPGCRRTGWGSRRCAR